MATKSPHRASVLATQPFAVCTVLGPACSSDLRTLRQVPSYCGCSVTTAVCCLQETAVCVPFSEIIPKATKQLLPAGHNGASEHRASCAHGITRPPLFCCDNIFPTAHILAPSPSALSAPSAPNEERPLDTPTHTPCIQKIHCMGGHAVHPLRNSSGVPLMAATRLGKGFCSDNHCRHRSCLPHSTSALTLHTRELRRQI